MVAVMVVVFMVVVLVFFVVGVVVVAVVVVIHVETNLRISAGSFAESPRYRGESRVGDAQGRSRGQD